MTETDELRELSSDLVVYAARLVRAVRRALELPAGLRVLSLLDEPARSASPSSPPPTAAPSRPCPAPSPGWSTGAGSTSSPTRPTPAAASSTLTDAGPAELVRVRGRERRRRRSPPGSRHDPTTPPRTSPRPSPCCATLLASDTDSIPRREPCDPRTTHRPPRHRPRASRQPGRSSSSRAPSGPSRSPASSRSWASAWSTRSSRRSRPSCTRRPSQVSLLFTSYMASWASRCWSPAWSPAGSAPSAPCSSGLVLIIVFAALAGSSSSVGAVVGFRAGWGLGNALFIATALATIVSAPRAARSRRRSSCSRRRSASASRPARCVGGLLGRSSWRGAVLRRLRADGDRPGRDRLLPARPRRRPGAVRRWPTRSAPCATPALLLIAPDRALLQHRASSRCWPARPFPLPT